MPFVRALLWIVVGLAALTAVLYVLLPAAAPPAPETESAPLPPAPRVMGPPPARPVPVMSPADATSPAEITAQEAADAIRRLEKEQEDQMMPPPQPVRP